jgi:thiamine-phosphate pyrophosphorylase
LTVSVWSRLYAIVDAGVAARAGWTPPDLARAYLDGGARLLQLRAAGVDGATQLDWCQKIIRLATPLGARLIVNDRCDLVLMAGAVGVHLGQHDLPIVAARRLLGPTALIGLSTHGEHDARQVDAAVRQTASYLAVGPIYDTRTKDTGYAAVGLEAVRRISMVAGTLPVVAIGGITLSTAPDVIAAGATSVAVIADLLADGDPTRRVRDYLGAVGEASPR